MGFFRAWANRIGRQAAKDAIEDSDGEIRAAIRKAIAPQLETAARSAVANLYKTNPRFRFIKWMQAEMLRVSPQMGLEESFRTAVDVLSDFLKDENIEFGDSRYSWDRNGAVDTIQAYEIEYWEVSA